MPSVRGAVGTCVRALSAGMSVVLACAAVAAPSFDPPAPEPVTQSAGLHAAWTGAWMGTVSAPPTNGKSALNLAVTIVVRQAESGPAVDVTLIAAGAMAKPATEIVAHGDALAFTLDAGGKQGRFEAEVAADGRTIRGSFAFLGKDGAAVPPSCIWEARRVDLVTDLPDARVYDATLDAMGQKLPMRLSLGEGPHGWCGAIDITAQGLRNLAVSVERTATGFRVQLPVGVVATIELTADAEMKVLEGSFSQAAFRGPIRFELAAGAKPASPVRPQHPVAPFPYTEQDIAIEHPAGHRLAGTLTLPSSAALARDGRFPAVVLVTGSGPQNRDEELLGHRPFAVIADALARAGVAVLRCDDRGVGASTGLFAGATSLDFASDADIASEWLKRQPSIDADRVGIVGHSEGAMIAPIVAMWQNAGDAPVHPLAFTVLLAPPAESGAATLTRQTARMYEVAALPADKVKAATDAHRAVMRAIEQFQAADLLKPLVVELVRSQLRLADTTPPDDAAMAAIVDGAMKQLTDPWMVEFIRFDPRAVLATIEVPTLAMCGRKDVQVVADANLTALAEIAERTGAPVTIRRYEGLNHLFQKAVTGLPDEYMAIETTFDPTALAEMVAWVVDQSKGAPVRQIPEAGRARLEGDLGALPPRLWLMKAPAGSAP